MERKYFDPRKLKKREAVTFVASAITTAALIAGRGEEGIPQYNLEYNETTYPGIAMSMPRVFPVRIPPEPLSENPFAPVPKPVITPIPNISKSIEMLEKENLGKPGEFSWPIKGQRITAPFGPKHPLGIDIFATYIPVGATQSGVVIFAGGDRCCSYGLYVELQHTGGYSSRYAHLSQINVDLGQTIDQGDVVGISGNSGNSSGPHLHFELRRNGQIVNPMSFLPSQ